MQDGSLQFNEMKAAGPRRREKRCLGWTSVGMLLVLTGLYSVRPEVTTAITVWPAWLGMLFGLILALPAKSFRPYLLFAWLLYGVVFVDEFRSVPRAALPSKPRDFRVVTLNCAGGSELAAGEVKALRPDLVLLQESPSRPELERLAEAMFGDEGVVIPGPDASILGTGLTPLRVPRGTSNFVAARWKRGPDQTLDVISLRLMPPVLRLDLYSPAAWQDFARSREQRGEEMAEIRRALIQMGVTPGLVGGDFNTPPDAPIQQRLTEGMVDAFSASGVGYGATCVNPIPCIVRIDQIWAGPKVECVRAWVVKTAHSDHRMLVADFAWR